METLKSVMDALREALTRRRGVVWLAVKQRAKFEGWLKPVEVSDGVGVSPSSSAPTDLGARYLSFWDSGACLHPKPQD